MEFNSVHSNVTNRIRILPVTLSTQGRLDWLVSKRESDLFKGYFYNKSQKYKIKMS